MSDVHPNPAGLVLVTAADRQIMNLICQQTLQPAGYRVETAMEVTAALDLAARLTPDCIIADLQMPGLNARDLMVMLQAEGLDIPVIVLARKGSETSLIQAFRLGAEDYLFWPVREPEVLAVVERVLKHVHNKRQRERMERQVQQANAELQQRVRELTTIYAIGKAVTAVTDMGLLSDTILTGAVKVTGAERAWFLLRDEATKVFFLVAHYNLPEEYAARLHQSWDDGLSPLVARAAKMLSLSGEALQRFQTVARLGHSILIVPVQAQKQVIGLLAVMQSSPAPFNQSATHLLEAVADYASISLVNARLFLAVEERLRALQHTAPEPEKMSVREMQNFNKEQTAIIEVTVDTLERLAKIPASHWTSTQREALVRLRDQVEGLIRLAEATAQASDR